MVAKRKPTACFFCKHINESYRQLVESGCSNCGRRNYPYHARRARGVCAFCPNRSKTFRCQDCADYRTILESEQRKDPEKADELRAKARARVAKFRAKKDAR